jgi:hypothetical protein
MSERKNINKLFQEKFENFEVTPNEIIWENIENKLRKKKKRSVIPFWWKLSGIAAALLIGLFVYNKDSKISLNIDNGIVNQEKDNSEINSNSTKKISEKTNTTIGSVDVNSENSKNTIEVNANKNSVQSAIVSNNNSETNSKNEKESVAFKTTKNKVDTPTIVKNNSDKKISFHSSKNKKTRKTKSFVVSENNTSLAVTSDFKERTIFSEDANNNSTDKTKSVLIANIKIDSAKIANVEQNALEELLKEKESKQIIEPKLNRWQVYSNVAPIYFSSISNGSPLDNSLEKNDKSYMANNPSYGVGVNYALNKKVKIRTSINVLNVAYNTNGIVYYQTQSVSGKLANLNPNMVGNSIIIENLSNVDRPFNKMEQKSEGSLNQKLGYVEMPLEVTYKILDKNFGIDFIGGMSTMILNKNEIYLQSSDLNLKIGEANNLNSVHFSGNIGLGFKYGLFKHLDARIEPIFKYQINTFSNDSGNFKPYLFGVYSGINFTF